MPRLQIRPEQPGEHSVIGATHTHAFHDRRRQAAIVALHQRRLDFETELSLVAEYDGQIVAHALFAPRSVRLLGQHVRAVNLASLAVDPVFQGQGFGVRLIHEGHAIASARGYALSFLVGHPAYYRRFGYRSGTFGSASVAVPLAGLPHLALTERSLGANDIPAIRELWQREEHAVDFDIDPGGRLEDWLSPNPNIRAVVYVLGNQVMGYLRTHTAHPGRPHVFLAADPSTALAMAASSRDAAGTATPGAPLVLPLHPASASAPVFGTPQCTVWASALALNLNMSPFDEYYAQVQAGLRPPGRVIWPVEFDVE